jgi:hypothetical protein
MKKSIFNKSFTRIVMSLGTVGVLSMAPMTNAFAFSSLVVQGSSAQIIASTFFTEATSFCAKKGKKFDPASSNLRYVKSIKVKPGLFKAKIKFNCVR